MKRRLRKIMSIALAMLMTIGMMPMTTMAIDNQNTYNVNFGTGSWTVGNENVTAKVDNQTVSGLKENFGDQTVIWLDGFNPDTMEAVVTGSDDFSAVLSVAEGETRIADNGGATLPGSITFAVQAKGGNQQGGKQIIIEGYDGNTQKATYTLDNHNVVVSFNANNIDGASVVAQSEQIGDIMTALSGAVTGVEGFVSENDKFQLRADDGWTATLKYANGTFTTEATGVPHDSGLHFEVASVNNQGGGEGGQPSGNEIDVKINLGCPQDYQGHTWTGTPMINHKEGTVVSYDDTYKMFDNQLCQGVCVWVLEDGKTYDGARSDYGDVAADGFIHFKYHGQGNTRKIVVASQWSDVIEAIMINGTPYTNFVSYNSPMDEYMAHFAGQMVYNVFEVPVNLDETTVDDPDNPDDNIYANDEVYNVQVALRPLDESECKVGNFLWSSDPKLEGTDYYVANAIMELVSIKFNGQEFTGDDAIKRCPYVGSYHANEPNYQGTMFGEMFVPAGAEVTMLITPEQGYQVTSFELSGDQFVASDTVPGQFTFTVGIGNMHIGGNTKKVEDVIKATATNVSNVEASINAGGDYSAGSANLSIANASPSAEKKTEFTAAAGEQNVDLIGGDNAYLAIDLNQVIFKANSQENADKENEVWTQAIHDLGDGYADVTMKFGNDVDVSTVVLVHNIGDGEDFETIRPISYDEANHTATFRIKSFSTFAIAQAHTKTVPVTPSNTNTNTNGGSSAPAATTVDTVPKTAETFPIVPVMVVAIVSFAAMAVVVFERKRRA